MVSVRVRFGVMVRIGKSGFWPWSHRCSHCDLSACLSKHLDGNVSALSRQVWSDYIYSLTHPFTLNVGRMPRYTHKVVVVNLHLSASHTPSSHFPPVELAG